MGDQNTALSLGEIRHVMRRTGFGVTPKELAKLLKAVGTSPTRGSVADALVGYKVKKFKPGGKDIETAHNSWVKYMLKPKSALQEKLVLFFHDHFATAYSVVGSVPLMAAQIQLLHEHAKGSFLALVKAVNKNAAMMEMLDTVRNRKEVPNENYSRELKELFTLGVFDLAGNPNYTQDDIVQTARAFTGWRYSASQSFLDTGRHDFMEDFPERGPKVIFKTVGGFGPGGRDFTANGEGAAEIDTVTDIIFQHTDSDGKNTVARRLAKRLLEYFCHDGFATPGPAEIAVIDDVIDDSSFDTTWSIGDLCRAIFVHDAFFESAAPAPYSGATRKSVKWPVDYFVTTLRLTGMSLKGRECYVPGGDYLGAMDHLVNMGQILLDPPSVFGWDWETSWISSSTLLARYAFARDIIAARGSGGFRPSRLINLRLEVPGDIVDAVTEALGVKEQISSTERGLLIDYLTDFGANSTLDLGDEDVRNTKLHGLFALVLQSPAFQLH